MKKTYYAPTIQTENVTIGVFGKYGCTNGGDNNTDRPNSYHPRRRGGKKWYNFW